MRGMIAIAAAVVLAGAAQAAAVDTSHVKEAEAFVKAATGGFCDMNGDDNIPVNAADPDDLSHRVFDINYRNSYDAPDDPAHATVLYQMFCMMGAYNVQSVFLLREPGEDSFKLLTFARPTYGYTYVDDLDAAITAPPVVTGYAADLELTNASFDPKAGTISSYSAWRGLGDAWSGGTWKLIDAEFVLQRYEVDPTYDLNADKPTGHEDDSYVLVGTK